MFIAEAMLILFLDVFNHPSMAADFFYMNDLKVMIDIILVSINYFTILFIILYILLLFIYIFQFQKFNLLFYSILIFLFLV